MSLPDPGPATPPPAPAGDLAQARTRRARPPTGAEMLRLMGTLLVFAIVGPPIGGLMVIGAIASQIAGEFGSDAGGLTVTFAAMLIWGWWVSYPLGILPALAAGVAVGLKRIWGGGAGIVFTLGIGLVIGAVWAFGFMDAGTEPAMRNLAPAIIAASVVATLACWLITGGVCRAAAMAKGTPT